MRMDVYRVINEAKEPRLIDMDEMDKLFSFANAPILTRIAAKEDRKDEKSDEYKFIDLISRERDDYFWAKDQDTLENFNKEFNSEIKKMFKSRKADVKKKLFDDIDEIADAYKPSNDSLSSANPNTVIFKMFLNEWNTKHSFTWKMFKRVKKDYERTHILEGEDLFVLKSLLEKDPNIVRQRSLDFRRADAEKGKIAKDTSGKITDSTIFSKANNTLTKETIEAIKKRIAKTE